MAGLSHKDDYLETPDWIIAKIEEERQLTFNIDLSASKENAKTTLYFNEKDNYLTSELHKGLTAFCNPPRSKNKLFVDKVFKDWKEHNIDIVMLLTWNDLGNKYGEKLFSQITQGKIKAVNLGKVKFCKNGTLTDFVSRLTYGYFHFRKQV